MKGATTFYIVRHGESAGNEKGILQGHLDMPLTEKGELQALHLAKELQIIKFDKIFSSDLLRAKRTAEIIALEHHLTISTTIALRERNYGHFQGLGKDEFTSEIGKLFDEWHELTSKEWLKHKIASDVESGEEMVNRMTLFLREIASGFFGQNILIVCHGDLMRVLLVHLGWASSQELRGKTIGNAAYVKLLCDGIDFEVAETKGIIKNQTKFYSW